MPPTPLAQEGGEGIPGASPVQLLQCCSAATAALVSGSTVCGGSNRPLHPHPVPSASSGLACCQARHCDKCKICGVPCLQALLTHAQCCGEQRTIERMVPQLLLLVASGGLTVGLHMYLHGMLCL